VLVTREHTRRPRRAIRVTSLARSLYYADNLLDIAAAAAATAFMNCSCSRRDWNDLAGTSSIEGWPGPRARVRGAATDSRAV